MLRALLERDIVPDLVLGTSVGALNGALVARDPELARGRPAHRAVARAAEQHATCTATGRCARSAGPCRTGTHLYSAEPLRERLGEEFGDLTFEELPVRFQCARPASSAPPSTGSPRAAVVDAVVASAAVPGPAAAGRGRRRALPRRRHRELDPGRPRGRARRRPGLRAPGRPDRPAADACRAGRGRWPGCPSRSPGGTGSTARWPSCPTASTAHVLPGRRHVGARRLAAGATATSPAVQAPHRRDVRRHARPTSTSTGCERAIWVSGGSCVAPAVVALTVLIWMTLPAVAARRGGALARRARAAGGRCGCCGWCCCT